VPVSPPTFTLPFFRSRSAARNYEAPSILLIAAHPDDETIGAGALIARLKNVRILHVTEGSPSNPSDAIGAGFTTREQYALARSREARRALAMAGIFEGAIANLCYVDQEVSFHMEALIACIRAVIAEETPEIILTHAYEGGHPDHDAVAFACHMAQRMQRARNRQSCSLVEFTGYHAKDGALNTYEFLPNAHSTAHRYYLDAEEQLLKMKMLSAFQTQTETLRPFLPPRVEVFRTAPPYDFTRPPHGGKLFYENFHWGVDGAAWRKLASQTMQGTLHP
jgi:LmbE family N-acetylglucosaminyl deacetylase